MRFCIYAICAGSGPVVIGSYGSASDQRRAYRDAQAAHRGWIQPRCSGYCVGGGPRVAAITRSRERRTSRRLAGCTCAARSAVTTN